MVRVRGGGVVLQRFSFDTQLSKWTLVRVIQLKEKFNIS